jgi:chromosome segregation ATPase
VEELSAKLSSEVAARQAFERQRLDLDRSLTDAREQLGRLQGELETTRTSAETLGRERAALAARQEELERLSTAQAAQVQNLQELLDQARGELAREVHLARLYMKQKEQGGGGAGPEGAK